MWDLYEHALSTEPALGLKLNKKGLGKVVRYNETQTTRKY